MATRSAPQSMGLRMRFAPIILASFSTLAVERKIILSRQFAWILFNLFDFISCISFLFCYCILMNQNKVTMHDAGMEYSRFSKEMGGHVLRDVEMGHFELWFVNKNHASYGIKFKNTHLEFARRVSF